MGFTLLSSYKDEEEENPGEAGGLMTSNIDMVLQNLG